MGVTWGKDTGANSSGLPLAKRDNLNIKIVILMDYNPLNKMRT